LASEARHIKNVFKESELVREVVVANFATTTQHGAIAGKTQTHIVEHFNLETSILPCICHYMK
jgi:hypothetical protein